MILDNDDDLDKARSGGQAEGASGKVDTGRIELDASLHNSLPTRDLGLMSSTACLLLPHKPNPRPSLNPPSHCKIRPTNKMSAVSLEARRWSLHSTPSPSLSTAAMMDGQMRTWLNWRKKWGWLWESSKRSHHRPAHLPPQVLARPRHHRTRSRVENAAKPMVDDQKSCETLVDMIPQLRALETRVAVQSLGRRELGEEALMEEAGGVEIRQQGELAWWPAVGDQPNQAEVDDTDDPMDKEATEALLATQLEIDKHRFRLRGIRTQQLPGRQTKTTQYRVAWGEHPNRSDSWVNEDDVQILTPRLLCERFFQNSVLHVGRDVMHVQRMRCSRRSKGKKIFEYLVDELSTWITEDQPRISLSPMLFAELEGN